MDIKLTYEAWKLGFDLSANIRRKMVGEFQMWHHQLALLAQVIQVAGDRDHIDIGTMWGGSAIFVALVKQKFGLGGKVHTIDPLDEQFFKQHKWYLTGDDYLVPTVDQMLENLKIFGVEDHIIYYQMQSADWPFSEIRPTSAFIDGAHDFDSVLTDWQNCKSICNFVLFHDYTDDTSWKDIKRVVDNHAKTDPDFDLLMRADTCIAFVRKDYVE